MADTNTPPTVESQLEVQIHCMIRNRNQILFDDNVTAITSKNDTGIFDVLPEHSNFISVINEAVTVHKMDGQIQTFPLSNGLMKVKNSNVNCYLDLITSTNKGR